MKKTHSRIMLLATTALALLLSFNGGAEQKNAQGDTQQEGTIQNDPQARGEVMQCCTDIFGSEEETGSYYIRVIDELDGGRVDEYDGARGAAAVRLCAGRSDGKALRAACGRRGDGL